MSPAWVQLGQMERQRRRLHPEPLGNDAGRQSLRPAGDEQTEQVEPGLLSKGSERGNRALSGP